MSVRANKMKQTPSFRLESLEDRSLLSVAVPSSVPFLIQPMKAPKQVTSTLTGSLTGTHQEGTAHLITTMTHGNLTMNGSTVTLAVSGPGEYKLTEVGHAAKWNAPRERHLDRQNQGCHLNPRTRLLTPERVALKTRARLAQ